MTKDTEPLQEALTAHYPTGEWMQPCGNHVLCCSCNENLWGVDRDACKAAWRMHVIEALATPASDVATIGSHFGNGGGLDPAAGEVAPVGDYHVTSAQYEAAVKGRQDFRQAYREQLNLLSQKEWAAVAQIGADQELSTSAVLRQAVRLYQMHLYRLKAGETFSWSGDEQRAKDFAGPLYAHPVDHVAGGEDLRDALVSAACDGIADDYMTSEKHHPGYVLIPSAKFEAILAALKGPAA